MTLAHPVLLVLGLLGTSALVVLAVRVTRLRWAALAAAGIAAPGGRRLPLGRWLSLAGVLLLAVAWAGPAAALPVGRSAGTVILAMDVSRSMAATDVAPTRLAAAQQAATAFIDAQPDNVDIGVVGFDQGALTTSLPTADREVSRTAVQHLRLSGGTSLAAAVLGSLSVITGRTVTLGNGRPLDLGQWGSATIVLFSDGGAGGRGAPDDDAAAAAALAQDAGVHLETVGVGTTAGTTVQVDGYSVHTALDADRLTALAQTTGGAYHAADDVAELADVASTIDLRLTVARQDVPLAGGVTAAALALLVSGAALTMLRTGRLV